MYFTVSAWIFEAWHMALGTDRPIGKMGLVSELSLWSVPGAMPWKTAEALPKGKWARASSLKGKKWHREKTYPEGSGWLGTYSLMRTA